jgi:hypothetical protein
MKIDFQTILKQFNIKSSIKEYSPFGDGHINDTFLIRLNSDEEAYVLQRINHFVFPNVGQLMANVVQVTEHIRQKIQANEGRGAEMQVLQFLATKSGKYFYEDSYGSFWRLCKYIANSHSYSVIPNATLAYQGGRAFGMFIYWLADFPAGQLDEIIPGFHDLKYRLEQFDEVLHNDPLARRKNAQKEADEILKRADKMANQFEAITRSLPKRIIHADTKFNNVLFGPDNQPLCIVDLDTVMPGYVISDFGDAIRTGTNTGREDDMDLERIKMNREYFEAYTRGFLEKTISVLREEEVLNLAFGALLLTYMQSVRFLTDYLAGDVYYKTKHESHNLQRTRAQLKLLAEMEKNYSWMQNVVTKYVRQMESNVARSV